MNYSQIQAIHHFLYIIYGLLCILNECAFNGEVTHQSPNYATVANALLRHKTLRC